MAKARPVANSRRDMVPSALLVMAFLSSGAWMIVRLPPVPVSKALQLGTVGVWLVVFGLAFVKSRVADRRILWGLGVAALSIAVSFAAGGSFVPVVFYDLFAEMPLVQWLAFPLVFLLAAGMVAKRRAVEQGLAAIVGIGVVLVSAIAILQSYTNAYGVFGSSAYSTTALAPLIPVAVGLAASRRGWQAKALYGASAYIAVVLAFFAGSTMATLAAVFASVLALAIHPAILRGDNPASRILRYGTLAVAGLMAAGLLLAQVPAVSGFVVNADTLGRFDKNIVTRAYMWEGAQSMTAARPFLGFGPSGYRLHAVEYLAPDTFQFGPDFAGSIDPSVYSPQSPHSVFWDVATRLGLVGVLAFGALFALWWSVVVQRLRSRNSPESDVRVALGAGFLVSIFVLLVNPALFAIGLFPAAAAGLAVGPANEAETMSQSPTSRGVRLACLVAGLLVILTSVWLGMGEWRAYTAPSGDATASIARYEATLRVIPGHPLTTRRLLESQLLVAQDAAEVRAAQTAVDGAPEYMIAYAPNAVNFAAHSLAQAERVGRTDLEWERATLDRAGAVLPPIPSLVAERLHLAVLAKDVAAVRSAVPDAKAWGGPYPYTQAYLKAAETLTQTAP